ncbi:PqqD family protein [Sphingobacterium multivorum]|uniref:PqqD family protein n=1 Tax=Sphingobacterium multivorum TaxID=28454 RepID=UPI00289E4D9E|nr:PqqD family protein [Sphingobacterium multivorum]
MKLRNDITLRKVGKEYIIVDPSQDMVDMSKVFTLNETAAFLWNELQGIDFELEDMINLLLDNYETERKVAEKDSIKLIEVLQNGNLTI